MNFIRKNKEKSNKNLVKTPDLPPSLTLPSFSPDVSVPIVATSPRPSPAPLSENGSSSSSTPPLYARFARGTFEIQEPEPLLPPPPRQTLRHRSSNDSGTGFRSGGVRDEVERLVVAKRNVVNVRSGRDSSSVKSPSIRSGISGRDSPLPSLSETLENPNYQPKRTVSQPTVVLPRPPTPPPPSPPKIVFAKSLPIVSSDKSLPNTPSLPSVSSSPSPTPVLKTPTLKTPPLKTSPLTSPISPPLSLSSLPSSPSVTSRRRVYSPLAAFHSTNDNNDASNSNVVSTSGGKDQYDTSNTSMSSASTGTSTPTTPASTLFASISTSTGISAPSSPTNESLPLKNPQTLVISPSASSNGLAVKSLTPMGVPASPLRKSPITGPGLARNASKDGFVNVAPPPAEGEPSPVKTPSSALKERGYFSTYPDREKNRRPFENSDVPSPSVSKADLPAPNSKGEPVTPISTRPSKSSLSTVDDDDPNLQAFVKNLSSSVSRHTTGDSETSSIASNILANAVFGETNRHIPRGARLSRIGGGPGGISTVDEYQTNVTPSASGLGIGGKPSYPEKTNSGSSSPIQTPSRKTSASLLEETLTSRVPSASANASTSTLNSISTNSRDYNNNSTPNSISSTRIASKSDSVRQRVRALEEEREREREKERLRRNNPWVRKDGTVGTIKSKKEERESKGARSISSSTVQQANVPENPPITPIEKIGSDLPIQHSDDGLVNKGKEPDTKLESSLPSEHAASASTTDLAPDTQILSERPVTDKAPLPSLIPIAIQSNKPRFFDIKPLPAPNGNVASIVSADKGVNQFIDVAPTDPPLSNKAGVGAFGGNVIPAPSVLPRPLPIVPSAAPSSTDAGLDKVEDTHTIVGSHATPIVNNRLRSGSTLDLDDDPFVRGPLVRQTPSVPMPTTTPVDAILQDEQISKVESLNGTPSRSVESLKEINGKEPSIERSLTTSPTDDHEVPGKDLPSIPQIVSAVDEKESTPPVSLKSFQKQHKHKESVITTYSDDSDGEEHENAETEDQIDEEAETIPSTPYPLERHLIHPYLFHSLLKYLSYADVLALLSVSRSIRRSLTEIRDLREEVLERFLHTVGYTRWIWQGKEQLVISLKDLNAYLQGVSTPMHEYAVVADAHLVKQAGNTMPASRVLRSLAASCRSYTRLVIRLREQAEAEYATRDSPYGPTSPRSPGSPTSIKHARHMSVQSATFSADSHDGGVPNQQRSSCSSNTLQYRKISSPLFRLHHAPLLRVFVPSPNGTWLSDESVLECEKELKRAGILSLLRPGDVVWDTAVAEEMNAGRLVWDGSYLIDLDYSYSLVGELPRYLHSLSFPPSYFHKVIRTNGNPLCQIDISTWGAEIINNVQLVQDKAVTTTPEGTQHSVLRWTHRSRFQVVPGTLIPDSDELVVDPKWVGTVVVEAEGTNEGLGDFLGRCGEHVAAKAATATGGLSNTMGKGDAGRAFRLIRSKSRPVTTTSASISSTSSSLDSSGSSTFSQSSSTSSSASPLSSSQPNSSNAAVITTITSAITSTVNGQLTTITTTFPSTVSLNTPPPSSASSSRNTGVIVGSAIGGTVAALLLLSGIFLLYRRGFRRKAAFSLLPTAPRSPPLHEQDFDLEGPSQQPTLPSLLPARGSESGSIFREEVWPPPSSGSRLQDPLLAASRIDLNYIVDAVMGPSHPRWSSADTASSEPLLGRDTPDGHSIRPSTSGSNQMGVGPQNPTGTHTGVGPSQHPVMDTGSSQQPVMGSGSSAGQAGVHPAAVDHSADGLHLQQSPTTFSQLPPGAAPPFTPLLNRQVNRQRRHDSIQSSGSPPPTDRRTSAFGPLMVINSSPDGDQDMPLVDLSPNRREGGSNNIPSDHPPLYHTLPNLTTEPLQPTRKSEGTST
ncbi:hypothetical protein Clacol_001691 [Clathrus columnatus]|uniref:F-box domain-containing protein n=1 Tax=Clathrus columnatus TaxID=1419009 RepID=A0AAV5A2J2_9AGAM|nr:hypothetical protein Clacol_001691 [Clathrus columnatus]